MVIFMIIIIIIIIIVIIIIVVIIILVIIIKINVLHTSLLRKESCFGKISAQPHTIVKQICFSQWQCIVFVVVFSIQELNVLCNMGLCGNFIVVFCGSSIKYQINNK